MSKTKKSIRIGSILAKRESAPHAITHLSFSEVISEQRVFTKEAYLVDKAIVRSFSKLESFTSTSPSMPACYFRPHTAKRRCPQSRLRHQTQFTDSRPFQTLHPRTTPVRRALKVAPPQTVSAVKRLPQTPRRLRITIISTYPPRSVGLPHNKDTKPGFHNA